MLRRPMKKPFAHANTCRESKYETFEASGPEYHTLNGIWDPRPDILLLGPSGNKNEGPFAVTFRTTSKQQNGMPPHLARKQTKGLTGSVRGSERGH